jgi:hypothetical protein
LNKILSLAYLKGKISLDQPGISSPHLKGQFWSAVRKDGTGFLKEGFLPQSSRLNHQYVLIFDWLKANNYLYRDVIPNISNDLDSFFQRLFSESVSITIADPRAPQTHSEGACRIANSIENTDGDSNLANNLNIPIRMRTEESNYLYFPLELALPLLFPLLFPYGKLPEIPGTTLRSKAQVLIQSHPLLRCGRLACHLILFLFDSIMKKEYSFSQNIQRLKFPEDATRRISITPRPEDPSFEEYWRRKQCEVRAMTFHFGCPDVMITFTFNNHWSSVMLCKATNIMETPMNRSDLDMRFQPFESMQIWNQKITQWGHALFPTQS